MAVVSVAVSFFVIILAICISAGFRTRIREGVADLTGDVQLTGSSSNYYNAEGSVNARPSYFDALEEVEGVRSVYPVVYRAGIVRSADELQGVMFKAVPWEDTTALAAHIPGSLARRMGFSEGDEMLAYFVSDRVSARRFKVTEIYDAVLDASENQVVFVSPEDLRRVNGWDEGKASALEVRLKDGYGSRGAQKEAALDLASLSYARSDSDDDPLLAVSAADRYSTIFDWLELIDVNVLIILLLMILVAGFNMISGVLIMLFRNISAIGTLKALGMSDQGIAGVFLRVAARVVAWGMLAGNALALLFCAVQDRTRLIKLDPANYFVSYVPVHVDFLHILAVDAVAFGVIMLLMLIPSLFISRVDPATTMRVR